MPRYIKYRGAGKVPITKATLIAGEQGKKDPRMHVWPREDWINKGEHVPVVRKRSSIYTQTTAIPRRPKKS